MFSLERYVVTPEGQILDTHKNMQPIKQFKSNKYYQCCIFDENGKHVVGVHNVVAKAFCDGWFEGCVVHHKDGNTHNNNASNLECLELSTHSRFHQKKYYDTVCVCPTCKQQFTWTAQAQSKYHRNKHSLGPFCSRYCARHYKPPH